FPFGKCLIVCQYAPIFELRKIQYGFSQKACHKVKAQTFSTTFHPVPTRCQLSPARYSRCPDPQPAFLRTGCLSRLRERSRMGHKTGAGFWKLPGAFALRFKKMLTPLRAVPRQCLRWIVA